MKRILFVMILLVSGCATHEVYDTALTETQVEQMVTEGAVFETVLPNGTRVRLSVKETQLKPEFY